MKVVSIDRSRRLADDPGTGHNRWHPDIAPIIEVEAEEEVVLETRDARDGWIWPGVGLEANEAAGDSVHPLTGPVYIKGARPGDLLEVEYLEIAPEAYGYTLFTPGAGFLADLFPDFFVAHWDLSDGWATSPQIPGVHIPDGCFVGTAGVAPSREQMKEWARREAALAARGPRVALPHAPGAVPPIDHIAREGLRTRPPRENGGNIDAKQLTKGSKLFLPVSVDGGLYSAGDAHFAQGDGEACLTAIEMAATVSVRFRVHEGEAARHNIVWPRFAHPGFFAESQLSAPRNFIATMGMPVGEDGRQEGGDLNLATRNALINMIALLQERGFSKEQAYIICSVAVDLRMSNVVDLPNVTVSALLSEAIFT